MQRLTNSAFMQATWARLLVALHGTGTESGNGTETGNNGLHYIMQNCSHCTATRNGTRPTVSCCASPVPIPVQCEHAIKVEDGDIMQFVHKSLPHLTKGVKLVLAVDSSQCCVSTKQMLMDKVLLCQGVTVKSCRKFGNLSVSRCFEVVQN